MPNLAFKIEYDGTNFLGWQIQSQGRTVQSVLEEAIRTILRTETRVTAAGRTDAGVHASGQVVHFKTTLDVNINKLKKSLNGVLPPDLRILDGMEVSQDFHARFSALGRRYIYRIIRRPSAIHRHFAWHVTYPLDLEALRNSCKALIGQHDFTSFCQASSITDGSNCEIRKLDWVEMGDELRLQVEANRFLHHMVRTIVGTAVDIGRGHRSPEAMTEILSAKDRKIAGINAPPHGLCLESILYSFEFDK